MTCYTSFASGSTGNCGLYSDGRVNMLIDAGTSTRYISSCLRQLGLELGDLTHVLITHGHGDHISALPVLGKHTKAELVCSEDTYYSLKNPWENAAVFEPGESFELLGCPVHTFNTPHDAPGSCGYVLGEGANRLAYCTDLGEMTAEVYYAIAGSPTVFIESNHDTNMLREGPYPAVLKRRIMSTTGHLSNARCAKTVTALCKGGTRQIILGHLSQENNTPRLAFDENQQALQEAGAAEHEIALSVAPAMALALPVRLSC